MSNPEFHVVTFPSGRELLRRLPPLLVGLVFLGVGLGLMVEARLGLSPWDVLHQGIAKRLGVEIGTVVIGLGVLILLLWIPLRQRVGLGTILNTILVGLTVNATIAVVAEPTAMAHRIAFLVGGVLVEAVGVGLYIGASLGTGPRDGLMTGIANRGYPVWRVRTALELVVLGFGIMLGGDVGVGTALFAFGIGPLSQVFLRVFHMPILPGELGPGVAGE